MWCGVENLRSPKEYILDQTDQEHEAKGDQEKVGRYGKNFS